MSFKKVLTTYTLYFGLVLLIMGLILTILGILGMFYSGSDFLKGNVQGVIDLIGDWKYWCILVGPILVLAGGWYFFDNIKKRQEFKELMETTSKKKFLQNLDRVEYLAWKLTPWHRIELSKKKRKFNIK
jgi:hypothetical protein